MALFHRQGAGIDGGLYDIITLAPPREFLPSDISDLKLWLDGSDTSTLYSDTGLTTLAVADGAVKGWRDKSGQGNHATQGTTASAPLRKDGIQNGRTALLFDGVDDRQLLPITSLSFPYRAFVVYQSTDTSGSLLGFFKTTGAFFAEGIFKSNTNTLELTQQNGSATTVGFSGTATGASWHIAEYEFIGDDTTFTAQLWADGTSLAGPTSNTGVRSGSGRQLEIGGTQNGSFPVPLSGYIAEIILYQADLADTDADRVRSYLRNKWGTP